MSSTKPRQVTLTYLAPDSDDRAGYRTTSRPVLTVSRDAESGSDALSRALGIRLLILATVMGWMTTVFVYEQEAEEVARAIEGRLR